MGAVRTVDEVCSGSAAEPAGRLAELRLDPAVGELPRQQQVDGPAFHSLRGASRRQQQRRRVRLGVERQPPDEQRGEVALGDAEPGAQGVTRARAGAGDRVVVARRVGLAVDAQRDHRQAHRGAKAPPPRRSR